MKKLVILTFLLSAPAFAHESQPETKFFQDEVKKNPETANILAWCSLIGLGNEDACKEEMYRGGNNLDPIRLEAATRCIEKSGLGYRVALDKYFKSTKDQSLVSHVDPDTGAYHLFPQIDPKKPKEPPHYYFWTAEDRQRSAFKMGDTFVDALKKQYDGNSSQNKAGGETKFEAGVDGIIKSVGSISVNGETSKTTNQLTPEMIATERAKGEEFGRNHPSYGSDRPHGYCVSGGSCKDESSSFAEAELQARSTLVLNPKEKGPKETYQNPSDPTPPDPFAPFTSGTATGGMVPETPKVNPDKPKDSEKPKTIFGPDDKEFKSRMNDCLTTEENKILKDQGSKTVDQDAQTKEDKEAVALQKLKNGQCDENFFGSKFCSDWKKERAESKAEGADAARQAAYENAMTDWQKNGVCDVTILGYAFCQAAHGDLVTTPTDSETSNNGTIEDGVKQPDSVVPVDGGHISTDPNAWHPPATTPAN